jgi:alcohol dehydrogenase class IV
MPAAALAVSPFRWQDGERLVRFGRGTRDEAPDLLGEDYQLLTTARALRTAPDLAAGAAAVHQVAAGDVDEVAAQLRGRVDGELLVALGGGRVIDVAKALAAADPPRRVAAVPTTLSAAEMTALHRHASGVPAATPRVRPAIVLNDPALSASQPEPQLAASALNSLAHAAEAPLTPLASPVPTLAALEGARLLTGGLQPSEPERDTLALGALLAGYAAGAAGFGLHHVMAQTLARLAGIGHGPANAILLPRTIPALSRRFPAEMERLGEALGGEASEIAASILARVGVSRLRECGVSRDALPRCAAAAAERPELALTPPPAGSDELLELYEAAW